MHQSPLNHYNEDLYFQQPTKPIWDLVKQTKIYSSFIIYCIPSSKVGK